MLMSVEKLAQQLTGSTGVLGENLIQSRIRAAAMENLRLITRTTAQSSPILNAEAVPSHEISANFYLITSRHVSLCSALVFILQLFEILLLKSIGYVRGCWAVLLKIRVTSRLGSAIAQPVSLSLLTAPTRTRTEDKSFSMCGGQSGTRAAF
jgi:hypothetical protein